MKDLPFYELGPRALGGNAIAGDATLAMGSVHLHKVSLYTWGLPTCLVNGGCYAACLFGFCTPTQSVVTYLEAPHLPCKWWMFRSLIGKCSSPCFVCSILPYIFATAVGACCYLTAALHRLSRLGVRSPVETGERVLRQQLRRQGISLRNLNLQKVYSMTCILESILPGIISGSCMFRKCIARYDFRILCHQKVST